MSRRAGSGRRVATPQDRQRLMRKLAVETGQTVEEVTEHIRQAVEAGWPIETRDGWQAALPADVAGPDWDGPIT